MKSGPTNSSKFYSYFDNSRSIVIPELSSIIYRHSFFDTREYTDENVTAKE